MTSSPSANLAQAADSRDMVITFSVFFGGGSGTPEHEAIFVSDAHGRTARRLTPLTGDANHPAWSPDGRKIAFDAAAGIYVMNARR